MSALVTSIWIILSDILSFVIVGIIALAAQLSLDLAATDVAEGRVVVVNRKEAARFPGRRTWQTRKSKRGGNNKPRSKLAGIIATILARAGAEDEAQVFSA
jgi:hypothetical protein